MSENGVEAKVNDVKVQQVSCIDVSNNETLCGCPNTPVNPIPGALTFAIAKVPVVLAEVTVKFNVLSDIEFHEYINEIKEIKKHLRITQSILIGNTNVLFVKGFIRKNIMYGVDDTCTTLAGFCGDIEHCTVDVPFEFTTDINNFITPPAQIVNNARNEFQFLREGTLPNSFAEKDRLLSGDFTEFNQESTEYFNELPYIELISSRIVEYDEFINRRELNPPQIGEIEFNRLEEKMVVYVTFKVLQKRQVRIGNDC